MFRITIRRALVWIWMWTDVAGKWICNEMEKTPHTFCFRFCQDKLMGIFSSLIHVCTIHTPEFCIFWVSAYMPSHQRQRLIRWRPELMYTRIYDACVRVNGREGWEAGACACVRICQCQFFNFSFGFVGFVGRAQAIHNNPRKTAVNADISQRRRYIHRVLNSFSLQFFFFVYVVALHKCIWIYHTAYSLSMDVVYVCCIWWRRLAVYLELCHISCRARNCNGAVRFVV